MSNNDYTPGDLVHLYAVATDPDTDLPVAPGTVTAEVINPSGTISTPSVTSATITLAKAIRLDLVEKDAPITGGTVPVYTADTTAALPAGVWRYRFAGTGVHQGASEGSYLVVPTSFPS